MTQMSMDARSWTLLLLLSLIWGGVFLAVRVALGEIGPLTVAMHRVLWACLLLWAVVAAGRLPLPRDPGIWAAFLVMGALNNAVPFSLQAWGQLHIPSGLVAIFNAGTAVFGILVAGLLLPDERLSARRIVGVALGFAGVATAIGLRNLAALDVTSLAQLAVVASTISYAFAGVWARARLGGVAPQVAAAGMLTGSTLIMVPVAWAFEGAPTLALSGRTWAALAYASLVATAGAYLLYYAILRRAGSGNLMLCTLLVAPVAIVLGAAFLGESLPPAAYGGFALLAGGLLILDGRALRALRRGPRVGTG
ncbi:EamA domain-containing membrane protein RarD [Hasllibacter halocynthiae]|uniref:EamA domain-containing membrane protein RarD n=1 Tax=Hasllibacter halocynthiae TaxID=595589 RepID=A0A2T0X8F0_9RHOB|nr:DMT family transporter [Hasllibacter halocynthiae]PRY95185.1 EamA domain-containing membrane protein RarD [Hasllibacter halocynthiae]